MLEAQPMLQCTFFQMYFFFTLAIDDVVVVFFFQITIVIILLGSSYPLLLTSQCEMISHVFLPETMNNILSSRFFPPPGNIFPFRIFYIKVYDNIPRIYNKDLFCKCTYSKPQRVFFSLSISYAFPSLLLSRTHYIYSPLYFSVVLNWTVLPL